MVCGCEILMDWIHGACRVLLRRPRSPFQSTADQSLPRSRAEQSGRRRYPCERRLAEHRRSQPWPEPQGRRRHLFRSLRPDSQLLRPPLKLYRRPRPDPARRGGCASASVDTPQSHLQQTALRIPRSRAPNDEWAGTCCRPLQHREARFSRHHTLAPVLVVPLLQPSSTPIHRLSAAAGVSVRVAPVVFQLIQVPIYGLASRVNTAPFLRSRRVSTLAK